MYRTLNNISSNIYQTLKNISAIFMVPVSAALLPCRILRGLMRENCFGIRLWPNLKQGSYLGSML
jgi:hypothetical protein